MITIETMRWRLKRMKGQDLPLVGQQGSARVVSASDGTLELLVGGTLARYTWERVASTWQRLLANHELSIAELGGQHDAIGLVSLLAQMQAEDLVVDHHLGVLRLAQPAGSPVHQPTAPRP